MTTNCCHDGNFDYGATDRSEMIPVRYIVTALRMQGAHSARIGCAEFGCLADAQAEAKRVLAVLKAEEPDSLFIIQVLDMDATSPYHSPVATFNPEGSIDGSFKLCNTCQSQT